MATPLSSFESLQHLVYHVFLPLDHVLPQSELEADADQQVSSQIASSVISAVQKYKNNDPDNVVQWNHIARMLERFLRTIETPLQKAQVASDMRNLNTNDILALHIRAQNAAVIIRKKVNTTVFEVFEVQPSNTAVMSTPGKIVRHYPGPAVEVPNSLANDPDFAEEIANILVQMDTELFEAAIAISQKAGSRVREIRDSNNPSYFTQLFLGILRGFGEVVDPPRVVKRIGDQVLWNDALKPWRRSPIWLIIRVAIQTSLDSTLLYKHFMSFYHADILSQCQQYDRFSSDLLYVMRVKMARRLFKIQDSVPSFVVDKAKVVADDIQELLQGRWSKVQDDQAESPKWNPSALDFHAATNQALRDSRAYLNQVFRGRSSDKPLSTFAPSHKPRLENVDDFTLYANGSLSRAFSEDKHIALFDFEASVYDHLSAWTSRNLSNASDACKTVSSCFEQYLSAAKSHYTVDVADQSIMLLTLMKLWVAIDELATYQIPLLRDFSPELPKDMLDPLLLRTSQHIEQARIIQQHISARHNRASSSNNSIFSDSASYRDFAVQYFRQSSSLQSVKSEIERDAQAKRDAKLRELQEQNEAHARLNREASGCSHEYKDPYYYGGRWHNDHSGSCYKCQLEGRRDNLRITLHEWPLPSNTLEAEVAVFELQRPAAFTIWRDTTYEILRDLGASISYGSANPPATLEGYSDLYPWLITPSGISARVVLASSTKTFMQSHYSSTSIPASRDSVCVNNGLKYALYDHSKRHWAAGSYGAIKFTQYGTLSLPGNSPFRHLRYALEGTSHTSNRVLADQFDCPQDLSLHEHIAFGTLRSGARLQWLNIARGIEENILRFSCQEVNLLHTQSAWQIGPLTNNGGREWHEELSNSEYGQRLVSQLNTLLGRVRANWLEATSVSTAVLLAARLLISASDPGVLEGAYQFLRETRSVTLEWLTDLQSKLKNASDESTIIDYQNRVCEMAAICRSTFDVDPRHVPHLLHTGNLDDLASLIKCSVAMYDNRPPDLKNAPEHLRVFLCRDHRLSHRLLPHILQQLRQNRHILCGPISEMWPDYQASPNGWAELPDPNSRWASTQTAAVPAAGQASQSVHINLLEGRLLIDGEPLGRLPRNYVQHPTYIRVFGQIILDVVPANSPGMKFSTRDRVHGYQVSFLLDETRNDLVIQARKDGHTFELVPFSRLTTDFPEFFSTDYHHWAHLESKVLEFRPLSHPWSSPDSQWLLYFTSNGVTTMKNKENGSLLIDIHSPLFESLSLQIGPLESSRYVHAISELPKNQIQVDLPRMRLSFFINEDMELESKNFRGDIVDNNRSTGTMFGLRNQLVLKAKDPVARSLPRSRSVLIPQGNVRFTKLEHHVSVTIDLGSDRQASFHRYLIDTDLGCLSSEAGLTSRLYKIYLHALTSHCLPDTLTGRTGTEEALCGLSESSASSFDQINETQAQLLKLIGSLTPDRKYYPAHLKCMQTTVWSALPPLSQHFAFSTTTSTILERANTLQIFHPLDFSVRAHVVSPEAILLRRAARATSVYYPPGTPSSSAAIFGDVNMGDVTHIGRESLDSHWTEEGQIAGWAARLAYHRWGQGIYKPTNLVSLAESWGSLQESYNLNLAYSSRWLNLDLSACWITLYNLCRRASADSNKYRLSSCIAIAAFSRKLPVDLVPVVVAFATNRAFSSLDPPSGLGSSFSLADGYQPTRDRVQNFVSLSVRPRGDTPTAHLIQQNSESYYEFEERRHIHYRQQISNYQLQFVQGLMGQWPSVYPQSPSATYASWFMVNDCLTNVQRYFSSCSQNARLHDHLQEVERALSSRTASQGLEFVSEPTQSVQQPVMILAAEDHWRGIYLGDLMRRRLRLDPMDIDSPPSLTTSIQTGPPAETNRLSALFSEFKKGSQPLNRRYGKELDESRKDLAKRPTIVRPRRLPGPELLDDNRQSYHTALTSTFYRLKDSLAPSTSVEHVVSASGVWPRITPRTVLQQLALKARLGAGASAEWQKELIGYARLFVNHQRSQRLVALAQSKNIEEFWKELELVDVDSGVEECDPDWLLVQIDGNFSARLIQRQVAKEMMSPSSGSGTILQLNMGEGKSSVIVPLIAASLADTQQLVRVIVLKPLWRQMFHLLVNRLSGLVNRRIYYLPFGRHIEVDTAKSLKLQELYAECMREGGILLAQPEHILSFKLMGIEKLISANAQESSAAEQLRDTQDWLTNHTRDILDESDEILHVRYQLVYTVGEQQPLEDHPDRWTTTQQLLSLLAAHVRRLKSIHPENFDYRTNPQGQFPIIRILPHRDSEVEKELIRALANDVLTGHIQNFSCAHLSLSVRKGMVQLLSKKELSYAEYETLKSACDPTMWRGLLLVRGLLASGILVFALKERHYRVDYGLDLGRSLLAVPFRAKDIPSLRAEFGHPDVAVVLTCLSYYYKGLTDDQLDQCFELLFKLDNPSLEYEQWVARNNQTPKDLRELTGVNIKDREQFRDRIIPTFSRNSAVVDFFLSSVVFPKSAKAFPYKLSTSGWDLAESKPRVTTGFSGTNDNRYLLPTSITQADPVKQLSTNALVLTYLLQPENNHYMCMRRKSGRPMTTKRFLKQLVRQEPEIRVLLDVGAQMLELQNEDLVRYWLKLTQSPNVEAAVYFNEKDELMVLRRAGTPSSFYSSPFAQQLDKCIVYLDDGHTRGTDLKLPRHTRALVTLGPKVTKDRLLQGCMRMRKLGHGQSVMFAAPPEIDEQIRSVCPSVLGANDKVDALDVLRWAMLETCKDLQHYVPRWAQQGIEHSGRSKAERKYSRSQDSSALERGWLTPEARKLEEMYGVLSPTASGSHWSFTQRASSIPALQARLDLFGIEKLEDPSMDEEQEREVSHEVEREQQVERPPKGRPLAHEVHPDVEYFIQTGRVRAQSPGFTSLFYPLSSFGSEALSGWSTKLFASLDFSRVIARAATNSLNEYMRPVNWVVQGPNNTLVVLSPYEVNELLPAIRGSRSVWLHIYAPRVTQSMRSFSNLDFYSIPSRPQLPASISPTTQLQLDIFAGQLYLSDYRDYTLFCAVLGLYILPNELIEGEPKIQVECDGFVKPEYRSQLARYHSTSAETDCTFIKSPIPMLKDLIGLRRKGMKYLRTHVGQILHARTLRPTDF